MGSTACAADDAREPSANDREELERLLDIAAPEGLAEKPELLRAARLLAEQMQGIDYASLGLSWRHPRSRTVYRTKQHNSFTDPPSRRRSEESHRKLKLLLEQGVVTEDALMAAFVREIGLQEGSPEVEGARFDAVLAALENELLLPLRALHEAGNNIYQTFCSRSPIPRDAVDKCVADVTTHVLQGDFAEWRYNNPVGLRQMEGLSEEQKAKWIESPRTEEGPLVVHEGAADQLEYFWATKIGGPSHGFDYEAECLLPLLANARHKVILVSDPEWPHHPAGRAHLRLLWTHTEDPKPVLWLEGVHNDDLCRHCDRRSWQPLVIRHLLQKASAMGAMASWDSGSRSAVEAVAKEAGIAGEVTVQKDPPQLVLRPSNGVVEASDYLCGKHDWVQMHEQVIGPFNRCVFIPA